MTGSVDFSESFTNSVSSDGNRAAGTSTMITTIGALIVIHYGGRIYGECVARGADWGGGQYAAAACARIAGDFRRRDRGRGQSPAGIDGRRRTGIRHSADLPALAGPRRR